jgi:4-hydroxy-tetrahydrodipicolinate reductase
MKRVALVGGAGRMGQAIAEGLDGVGDVTVVVLIDVHEPRELFGATYLPSIKNLDASLVDVVVDFSVPESVVESAQWCASNGVALVVGTTGLSLEQRHQVEKAGTEVGVVMASNFSLGAVLSERFAKLAAPYFDRVEIIELHHDKKVDAPSGTSISTAAGIAAAREHAGKAPMEDPTVRHTISGARGAEASDGIRIHSVRLPGLVAHQEVHFGGPGEGLTIRHDSFDRQSFVQGIVLAVRALDATPRFLDGISSLVQ